MPVLTVNQKLKSLYAKEKNHKNNSPLHLNQINFWKQTNLLSQKHFSKINYFTLIILQGSPKYKTENSIKYFSAIVYLFLKVVPSAGGIKKSELQIKINFKFKWNRLVTNI